MMQVPNTQLIGGPQQRQQQGRAGGAKPVRFPPWGRDDNRQRYPFFIPYAITVLSLHSKNIFARVQIRVSSQTLFAANLVPARFEVFKLISIAVLLRICVAQSRELKGEDVVTVGESHGIQVRDGFLKYRLAADGHHLVEYFKGSDHYRRNERIVGDLFRKECVKPVAAAE